MEAVSQCQILTIHVEGFMAAIKEHRFIHGIAAEYGRMFADRVLQSRPPQLTWPNDLTVPFTEYGDLAVALPADMLVVMGGIALDRCKNRFLRFWKDKLLNELREEVDDGRSIVILSKAGYIERVVSLAVIHIRSADGKVLVQLAKWKDNICVPHVQLPAVKCMRNESSDEAVVRLLNTKLSPLADSVEIASVERETVEEDSLWFSVRTVYMRKLFYSQLFA